MPTASAPDALLRLHGVDPQLIVARWSGIALLLFAPLALLPASMLPNAVPLVVVFGVTVVVLAARFPARALHFDLVTPFSIAFASVGLLYLGASLLQLLPTGNQRPVRPDFILRHAYYVLLWLPLMAGTAALFRNVLPDLAPLARRAALPALAALAIGDVASAIVLGDPARITWEGYTSFFDPGALTFLYALTFFLAVSTTGRKALPLAVVSIHCALSNIAGYGMMFDTVTGIFVFACMWAFALAGRRSPAAALFVVVALGGALVLGLMAGSLLPDVIGFDLNTQWRFLVWRENLFAALNSGSLGVGFGTPYNELSPGNIAEAYCLTKFVEFTQYAMSSAEVGKPLMTMHGAGTAFVLALLLAAATYLVLLSSRVSFGAAPPGIEPTPRNILLLAMCWNLAHMAVMLTDKLAIRYLGVGVDSADVGVFLLYLTSPGVSRRSTRSACRP